VSHQNHFPHFLGLLDLDAPRPGGLNAPVNASLPSWEVRGLGWLVLLSVKAAVGTQWLTILLKHVGVEEVALEWVVTGHKVPEPAPDAKLDIDGVLGNGVSGAERWVVWTWEELGANAGAWVVVGTAAALLRVGPSIRSRWGGGVGLGETIRASNDDLEVITVSTVVVGRGGINTGTPECALVVGDGSWVSAVVRWVKSWVTLNVDVEGSAESGVVTPLRAASGIVGGQGVETEISVGADRGVQITESSDVARWGLGILSRIVEWLVGLESRNGVWGNLGPVAIWLRSTCVLWVDETAVSAGLWGSGASSGGRGGSSTSGRFGSSAGGNSGGGLAAGTRRARGARGARRSPARAPAEQASQAEGSLDLVVGSDRGSSTGRGDSSSSGSSRRGNRSSVVGDDLGSRSKRCCSQGWGWSSSNGSKVDSLRSWGGSDHGGKAGEENSVAHIGRCKKNG
jgi:hypothetical protein